MKFKRFMNLKFINLGFCGFDASKILNFLYIRYINRLSFLFHEKVLFTRDS
jgi:hypothetical protein